MNINRFSINSLLKLTLIFGIILGVANSVSAKENGIEQTSGSQNKQEQSGKNNYSAETDKKSNTSDKTQQTSESEDKQEESKKSTDKSGSSKPGQSVANDDNKYFPIKDSLIFINLPIAVILLLLWFLNKNQQQKQINNLTKNQNKILGKLNQLNEFDDKLNSLERIKREIIKEVQENNQKITDSEIRLREFLNKQQVSQPINHQTPHNNVSLYSNSDSYLSPPDISNLNSVAVVDDTPHFVETYNRDKNSLSDEVIATVAETQESLNQRRLGNSDTVTLENTPKKKYWIIEENSDCYLIPHAKIKIDEYNQTTLESLFDCPNFNPEYSEFQLIQPAKVSQLSPELWQLEKKGKLNFS